jgi:hypothetical protein
MTLICQLVAIAGIAYLVLIPRIFDWFTVAFCSSCIYMMPAFVGYSQGCGEEAEMAPGSYLACLLVLTGILLGAVLSDLSRQDWQERHKDGTHSNLSVPATTVVMIGMIHTFVTSGSSLWAANKQDMLDSFTIYTLLWRTGCVLAMACCYLEKRWILLTVNMSAALTLWILGMRSPFVLSCLCLVTLHCSQRGKRAIIGNWRLGLFGCFMVLFVFSYKKIYEFVKSGHWSHVVDTLSQESFLTRAILESEAMSQTHILNVVITDNYRTPLASHLTGTFMAFFASGANKADEASFGGKIAADLFPAVWWGIESNIWAEMYSIGSWCSLLLFLLAYGAILHLGSLVLFYIHRYDLYRILSIAKQNAILACICGLAAVVLTSITPSQRSQSRR